MVSGGNLGFDVLDVRFQLGEKFSAAFNGRVDEGVNFFANLIFQFFLLGFDDLTGIVRRDLGDQGECPVLDGGFQVIRYCIEDEGGG